MSEDKIETKKKEKSVWKTIGGAALTVGSLIVLMKKGK